MFNKEIFKNITLSLLVCTSISLCLYIFIGNELWPSGYNFFIGGNYGFVGKIISVFGQGQTGYGNIQVGALINPIKIIITKDGKRELIKATNNDFIKIGEDLKGIISQLGNKYTDSRLQEIEDEEWFQALKYKSVYINYNEQIPTKLWQEVVGIKGINLDLKNVRDIIITQGDSVLGNLVFMFMETDSGKKYKLESISSSEKFDSFIEKNMVNSQAGIHSFSFELNFDVINDNQKLAQKAQKVLLNSNMLISFNEEKIQPIKILRPLDSSKQDSVENIVRLFGFRLGGIKRYVEMNNTVIFVENYATLKIFPDGLVEYQAIESDKGLKLFEKPNNASQANLFSESLRNAAGFVRYLNKSSGGEENSLELTNIVDNDANKGLYKFYFDYNINGLPVLINSGDSKPITSHAVEIEIQNGRVQSLKQYVRGFESESNKVPAVQILKAVNNLSRLAVDGQIEVSDAFLSYVDNGTALPEVLWCAKIKGSQGIVPMK